MPCTSSMASSALSATEPSRAALGGLGLDLLLDLLAGGAVGGVLRLVGGVAGHVLGLVHEITHIHLLSDLVDGVPRPRRMSVTPRRPSVRRRGSLRSDR